MALVKERSLSRKDQMAGRQELRTVGRVVPFGPDHAPLCAITLRRSPPGEPLNGAANGRGPSRLSASCSFHVQLQRQSSVPALADGVVEATFGQIVIDKQR
jgi:hypothetical protein